MCVCACVCSMFSKSVARLHLILKTELQNNDNIISVSPDSFLSGLNVVL